MLMEVATGDEGHCEHDEMCRRRVSRGEEQCRVRFNGTRFYFFKTASIMVALEDGKISKNDFVDTGNGQWRCTDE